MRLRSRPDGCQKNRGYDPVALHAAPRGGRSTGSSFSLAIIVQLTSDKVHQVNRWKNVEPGYPPRSADLPDNFLERSMWGERQLMWGERQFWDCFWAQKRNSGQVWNLTAETTGETSVPRNYRAAVAPVTCKIICVPASNFTLRLAELTTEPWALAVLTVFKAIPCIPTTPRVAELIAPFAATPVA